MARSLLGVEVATGSAFGVTALRFGWSPTLVPVLVLIAGLVATSTVDLACSRIPTRFVHLTGAGLVASIGLVTLVDGEPSRLVGATVGAATSLALLGSLYLVAQTLGGEGFGLGDVRLGSVVGLVTGWVGWPSGDSYPVVGSVGATLLGLVLAGLMAAPAGLALWVSRSARQPYPFGPWLSLGGGAAVLVVS